MSRNSRTIFDITGIILFLIVSVIGLLFVMKYFGITFEKEISFDALINLCLGILAAFVFPVILGKMLDSSKSSRELLVTCCCEIQSQIEFILKIVNSSNANDQLDDNRDEINYIVSILGTLMSSLKENLEAELPSFSTEKIMENFVTFREIQEDLTLRDFSFNGNYRIKVNKAAFQFKRFIEKTKFDIHGW